MSSIHRSRVLSLYKALLTAAQRMPTENRRKYVIAKTRYSFRISKEETNQETIGMMMELAETSLENVSSQAVHLKRVLSEPGSFQGRNYASRFK